MDKQPKTKKEQEEDEVLREYHRLQQIKHKVLDNSGNKIVDKKLFKSKPSYK